MEDKDIIGKEFICCEFENMSLIKFNDEYLGRDMDDGEVREEK